MDLCSPIAEINWQTVSQSRPTGFRRGLHSDWLAAGPHFLASHPCWDLDRISTNRTQLEIMRTEETEPTKVWVHLCDRYPGPANPRHFIPLLSVMLLLLFGGALPGTAGTIVSGTIVNQVWDKNGSPYSVYGNILVAGLTISNGVTVSFQGNFSFEVQGVLKAYGTADAPIVFHRPGTAGWQGIYFNYSSPGSELAYCIISNSVNSGIRILNSAPLIRDSVIVRNSSTGSGGGINIHNDVGNLTVCNCKITNNTAAIYGGGITALMGTNTVTLDGCLISGNTANPSGKNGSYVGGGIYVAGNSVIDNCMVRDNFCNATAGGWQDQGAYGGGAHLEIGRATVRNSIFFNNTATSWTTDDRSSTRRAYGGGVVLWSGSLEATNVIWGSNVTSAANTSKGGGMFINGGATGMAVNCTFAYNNTEGLAADDPKFRVMNSILYFNAGGGTQISGPTSVTYCDVQGGLSGVGNINLSPAFGNPNDLKIVVGSPCIDAGNPSALYNDWASNGVVALSPSLGGQRNDMGAHGGPGAIWWGMAPVVTSPPGDQIATNDVTLCVQALGTPPLSYQWLVNGAPILGAVTSCYAKSTVEVQDEGLYSVVVSNAWGSATSHPPARVTVAIPHAATATAIVVNGFVVGYTDLWGGWGYTNTPAVRFIDGAGSGAEAEALVTDGVVTEVKPLNPGSGFANPPLIVIAPPFIMEPKMTITAHSLLSFTNLVMGTPYRLQSFRGGAWINEGGAFFPTNSTFTHYVPGTASPTDYRLAVIPVPRQAFATAVVTNGFVVGAIVTSGGSGYTSTPAVTIHGAGTNATAITILSGDSVSDVKITNPGIGYTTGATIVIAPPPAAALSPNEVTQMMELCLGSLSPYDGYQLELWADSLGSWSNLGVPFVPTSASCTQRVSVSQSSGFFRVRYLP